MLIPCIKSLRPSLTVLLLLIPSAHLTATKTNVSSQYHDLSPSEALSQLSAEVEAKVNSKMRLDLFDEPEGLELLAQTESLEHAMSSIAIKNFRERHSGDSN
jgi:hypothetical protein